MAAHQRLVLLHLSLINQTGPATIEKLVQALSLEHLEQLYTLTVHDLCALAFISELAAKRIVAGLADKKLLDKELELLERYKLTYITLYDTHYPLVLKSIYLPPPVLYIKGMIAAAHMSAVALVGARKADAYGSAVISQLVPELVTHGYSIVSGGAVGIDTLAHIAALQAGGTTVAVLGSGLLRPYPGVNAQLFEKIANTGGCVISPFSLTRAALAEHFPARNRIIAGLSAVTVVVQAAEKSGALITARYALEQGREVGAVPGPITSALSAGCHKLLSEGAALITHAQDIAALMATMHTSIPVMHASIKPENSPRAYTQAVQVAKSELAHEQACEVAHQPMTPEKLVLSCARIPVSFDELLEHTALTSVELQDILCTLQFDGRIEQNFAGLWYSI